VPGPSGILLRKCERLQIVRRQKELAWKAVAQPHLPMALLAQRHRDWGCLLVLPPQTSNVCFRVRAGRLRQPSSEMRTSAGSSQAEKTSLESCCSASSAHGTARTEAQRLGLLDCLATLNVQHTFWGFVPGSSVSPAVKCERLQIARRHKEQAWKAVAQPHLPMALLTQRHRDWGCLLVLPPQTSYVNLGVRAWRLRQPAP